MEAKKFYSIKLWISIASFMFTLGMGLYMNILPLYIKSIGADATVVGTVFSLNSITRAFVTLLAGYLTHKMPRKKLFLIGWLFAIAAGLAYAFIPTTIGVATAAILMGLSNLSPTARSSMLLSLAPNLREFNNAMYTISASFSIGFILGPPIGGYMVEYLGWKSVFLTFSGLILLGAIMLQITLPEVDPLPDDVKENPFVSMWRVFIKYRYLLTIIFLAGLFSSLLRANAPLWFKDGIGMKERTIGTLSSLTPVASLLLSMAVTRLHAPPPYVFKTAIAGFSLSSIILFITSPISAALYYILRGGGFILLTISQTVMSARIKPEDMGKALGSTGALLSIGSSIGLSLGGMLYDYNPYMLFLVSAIVNGLLLLAPLPRPEEYK
ncbi:MFS transporter [bacterium 3DAC]|nr:MFS transporter [bacterium 3DAC]